MQIAVRILLSRAVFHRKDCKMGLEAVPQRRTANSQDKKY